MILFKESLLLLILLLWCPVELLGIRFPRPDGEPTQVGNSFLEMIFLSFLRIVFLVGWESKGNYFGLMN